MRAKRYPDGISIQLCQCCGRQNTSDQDEWMVRVHNKDSFSGGPICWHICRRCVNEIVAMLETKRRALV